MKSFVHMKTHYLRAILTIVLCSSAIGGWGQETILSENFDSFNNDVPIKLDGWSFKYCYGRTSAYWETKILTIQKETAYSANKGYAKTPALSHSGGAILSFNFCAAASNVTSTINISVSNGTIEGGESVSVSSSNQKLTQQSFHLSLTPGAIITFALTSDAYAAIDDILIVTDGVTISEDIDNTSTLTANADKTVTVNLARTLTGGIWNTLCLPFDVTMEDMKLALEEGQDIKMRTFSSYADKVMTFAEATAVSAGTPFLIKLNTTVEKPTFHAVTVKNITAKSVTNGGVSFVGTYDPIDLNTDGRNLFITTRNTLASPASGANRMKGLRAYIVVPENFDSSGARLMMDDGETTAVSELVPSTEGAKPEVIYNLKGQRVKNGRRGLYVINGKLTLVK